MPALARAVRPLAAGEPTGYFEQGCGSLARAVRPAAASAPPVQCRQKNSFVGSALVVGSRSSHKRMVLVAIAANADPLSARCRSQASRGTLRGMQVAALQGLRAQAHLLLGAAVPLSFACRPTPPSSGRPSAAAHVER
jgi:hypothetical protein